MPSKEAEMKGRGLVVSFHQLSLNDSNVKKNNCDCNSIRTVKNIQLLKNWMSVRLSEEIYDFCQCLEKLFESM